MITDINCVFAQTVAASGHESNGSCPTLLQSEKVWASGVCMKYEKVGTGDTS